MHKPILLQFLLFLIPACNISNGGNVDSSGASDAAVVDAAVIDAARSGDGGGAADAGSCAGAPASWPLPGAGKRFDAVANQTCGFRYHITVDLDGDLRPDLVETFDCMGGSDEGSKYWLVYKNTGSGFAATATQWPLPGGGKRFDSTANNSCGFRYYATFDMDGDLRPDLVETFDCMGGADEGSKYWLVYKNTGSGFAATATQWPLPGAGKRFDSTANNSCGFRYHITLDMDGDLRPDLVETYDCVGGSDEGSKYWLVYKNTGSGFAATATQWPLPGGGKRFDSTANNSCGFRYYATFDMDGDRKPELVETYDCMGGSDEGSKYWLVYKNTGSGFAAATQWPLPGGGKRFDSTANNSCGFRYYATFDMDGDRKPELVETYDCMGGSDEGSKYWLVHKNTGSGFAAATQWPLPGGGKRFDSTANNSCGFRYYATLDMDGDLRPEIVETFDCMGGSDEGSKYWLVYPMCMP